MDGGTEEDARKGGGEGARSQRVVRKEERRLNLRAEENFLLERVLNLLNFVRVCFLLERS